jgi:hypothetical protein
VLCLPAPPRLFQTLDSKWFLVCYTAELSRRLVAAGSSVKAVCADPGISPGSSMWDNQAAVVRILARYVFAPLTKSVSQGAATAVHTAVCDFADLVPGAYYSSGEPGKARPDADAPESWAKLKVLTDKCIPPDVLEKVGRPGAK